MWSNIEAQQAAELINKEIGHAPGYFFIADEDEIKKFDKLWKSKKYQEALNLIIEIENLKDLKEYMEDNNYGKGGGIGKKEKVYFSTSGVKNEDVKKLNQIVKSYGLNLKPDTGVGNFFIMTDKKTLEKIATDLELETDGISFITQSAIDYGEMSEKEYNAKYPQNKMAKGGGVRDNRMNERTRAVILKIQKTGIHPDDVSPNFVNEIANEYNIKLTSEEVVFISDNYGNKMAKGGEVGIQGLDEIQLNSKSKSLIKKELSRIWGVSESDIRTYSDPYVSEISFMTKKGIPSKKITKDETDLIKAIYNGNLSELLSSKMAKGGNIDEKLSQIDDIGSLMYLGKKYPEFTKVIHGKEYGDVSLEITNNKIAKSNKEFIKELESLAKHYTENAEYEMPNVNPSGERMSKGGSCSYEEGGNIKGWSYEIGGL